MASKKPQTTSKAKSGGASKSSAAKGKVPKDPEAIRKLVLADPNTAGIAKNIGVPLEEYVNQVVHFVLNPNAEPSVYVAEDDDLRSKGFEPPDADAIGKFLVEAVTVASAADATEYTDPKGKLVNMDGPKGQPEVPENTDANLKKDLDKALRAKRGGKG